MELFIFRNVDKELINRPIFFLGAPRSGTTLAMQVITDVFDVGYLSNFHCKYFFSPAIIEKFLHPTCNRPKSDFKSTHGVTDADYAPSEASKWWYRFFRRNPRYVDLDRVDDRKMINFRRSVRSFLYACGKLVIFKNPHASLRILPIVKYIPESLFIIVRRNEIDNAHSLLEVRKNVYDNYNKWWSMEPPLYHELKGLPAHEQVIEQIRHIYSTIDGDLDRSKIASSKCFHLDYDDLCNDPKKEMERLQLFFNENGCNVTRLFDPPSSFELCKTVRIDRTLYENVVKYAEEN